MTMANIDVGDISVKYLTVGAGDPVVLLHCTGGSGQQWAAVAEALRTNFQVITPDLCGYGGTTHWTGAGTFNLAIEADLVGGIIGQLKRPAHIVGHSYGGAVALQLALRRPEHFISLTLIEPAAFHLLRYGDDEDERAVRQISEVATMVANAVNCGDYQGAMRHFVNYWGGDGAWDFLPKAQQVALAARINKVTLDFWATLTDPSRLSDFNDLAVPTLIMSGGLSPFPARRICFHLARTLADVSGRIIDDAGHMLPFTHCKEALPLITAHWARHQHSESENGRKARAA
jgi:pimeloyl-ACP methyl ester carboxylesterase